ncbi:MAG: hypothetical protein IPO27_04065 [Bacteroidetes bacterium]|nr:hypothetical protein [Bacteroidota bacterium]
MNLLIQSRAIFFALLCGFIGLKQNSNCQNLIINGNFEDTIPCGIWNVGWLPILPCSLWYQSYSSSDFLSSSYTQWCGSAPIGIIGYQLPKSGSSYCGFATYVAHPDEGYREFLGGVLTDSFILYIYVCKCC